MLGTQLRPATVEDYPNFLRFFAELGVSDPKPTLEHWCAHMLPTSAFFEQGGSLVGYAFSDIKPPLGYVRHVVIASEHRGQGLGHSLMATLREYLVAHGCTRWCLNVKLSNTSARRLYQRIGMTDRYLTRVVRLAWPLTVRLPTPGANIRARSLGEAEDREVEPHFDLAPGALQARRQRPGTFIATATPNSEPSRYLGLAVFDLNFPGAFPFRASSPSTARALLELLVNHRRPEHGEVQLVIEDDKDLADALLRAGATPVFELVHMAGDIA